ncbi:hydrogenase expression/formation protein HypE [Roseiconus nitratireducens]|uniref:Hydrogenase expression/formation protein HypE n=1 Tax=Roseiconus nitratireducens TaxID=2605748 RepID=A0A5M6DCA1_9BACT|nr:hydrogenase expression/formation protein HypE [Roseiconus nitratireducens]KAA5543709.1 hydrogenase expression/formation protein HypE [Roseiconus nitratireducens]
MTNAADFDRSVCPTPRQDHERVLLGHGSGGRLSADLVGRVFLPEFGNEVLSALEDAATLTIDPRGEATRDQANRIAFTTDSFVVKPLFFPGGDIGKLAVHGTVNDLAVSGAQPLYLSAAFILEEGFQIDPLRRIVRSMRQACAAAGVALVTGDTKVVDRGKGDQIFITTTGIGVHRVDRDLSIHNARPGDAVIVSGTIGDHGITIMSTREGIEFETALESDTAPLNGLVEAMLEACPTIRAMRDPTRGGVSSTLNELAVASHVGIVLDEASLPVKPAVHSACEMLGLDPLYVANEGKLIAVVPGDRAEPLVEVMRRHPLGRDAAVIGRVVSEHPAMVVLRNAIGGQRVVSLLAGEQLPRIC